MVVESVIKFRSVGTLSHPLDEHFRRANFPVHYLCEAMKQRKDYANKKRMEEIASSCSQYCSVNIVHRPFNEEIDS